MRIISRRTVSLDEFSRKKKISRVFPLLSPLFEKKGMNIVLCDISRLAAFTDLIMIVSASSTKHAQTLADGVREKAKERKAYVSIEGYTPGEWILIDIGTCVINIFTESMRKVYDIESLWHGEPIFHIRDHKDEHDSR